MDYLLDLLSNVLEYLSRYFQDDKLYIIAKLRRKKKSRIVERNGETKKG